MARFKDDGIIQQLVSAMLPIIIPKIIEKVTAAIWEEVTAVIWEEVEDRFNMQEERIKVLTTHLENKIDALTSEIATKADELEQYNRRVNLRVFGIEEEEGEDTDELVTSMFNTKLGLNVVNVDISRSHRIGSNPSYHNAGQTNTSNSRPKPRPFIVRFVSYRTSSMVFEHKNKLARSGIVIREDLTQRRREVLQAAVTEFGFKNVWTRDGLVLWTANNRKFSATSLHELKAKTGVSQGAGNNASPPVRLTYTWAAGCGRRCK